MPLTISGSSIGPWESVYYGGGYTSSGGFWSRGVTGYCQLEGGFILQWGQATTTNTTGRYSNLIYFPISFPTACLSVVMCEGGAAGWGTGPGASNNGGAATMYAPTLLATAGFYFEGGWITGYTSYYSASIGSNYMAVGY